MGEGPALSLSKGKGSAGLAHEVTLSAYFFVQVMFLHKISSFGYAITKMRSNPPFYKLRDPSTDTQKKKTS